MKYIILLLLVISCGKAPEKQEEIEQDRFITYPEEMHVQCKQYCEVMCERSN